MQTFIAENIEVTEVELVANGYKVSQRAACEYARKLWANCKGPAKRRAKACYGANFQRKTTQVC